MALKRKGQLLVVSGVSALAAVAVFALVQSSSTVHAATTVAPAHTAPPTISGVARAGETLTASPGTWSGTTPINYVYRWQRCDANGGNCSFSGGTTTQTTNVLTSADVGSTIRVVVTANNTDGSVSETSVPTAVVAAAAAGPANTALPTISGTPQAGKTLTVSPGTWTGATPITYVYQWQRCNATGGSCAPSGGTTTQTTTVPTAADVGSTLRVTVTATNAGGTGSATSAPTAVIAAAVTNGCSKTGGTVPVSGVTPPARLLIDQMQVTDPARITHASRSVTIRVHVTACAGSVEGALVYATAVPYAQFSIPAEQATGSDGWATLQFSALAGYPVSSKQQLLVMFVRARKSGENLLAGISTRRLVSFRVVR